MFPTLLFVSLLICGGGSIIFQLPPNSVKCLREEIRKNELVTGDFEVTLFPGQRVDLVITDSKRNILSKLEDIKRPGKFSFITEEMDLYEVCFRSKVGTLLRAMTHEVTLSVKKDAEAKPMKVLEEASLLKPMEFQLRKLENLAMGVVDDFVFIKMREKEMRDTNESTSKRVLYLNIFSLFVLISLAVWQVLYLRHFFKQKKLLD